MMVYTERDEGGGDVKTTLPSGEYAQCVVVVGSQGGRDLSDRYRQNENKMEKRRGKKPHRTDG